MSGYMRSTFFLQNNPNIEYSFIVDVGVGMNHIISVNGLHSIHLLSYL